MADGDEELGVKEIAGVGVVVTIGVVKVVGLADGEAIWAKTLIA